MNNNKTLTHLKEEVPKGEVIVGEHGGSEGDQLQVKVGTHLCLQLLHTATPLVSY